jgi:hypothetical protein
MTDLVVQTARSELLRTPEGDALAKGLEAVCVRCDVGGDIESERCEQIQDDTLDALRDDEVTPDELAALLARYPELNDSAPAGGSLDRIRKRIDKVKHTLANDVSEWDAEAELARRFQTLGWAPECSTESLQGGEIAVCTTDIGQNTLSARVYAYESRAARRADNEDTYIPGVSRIDDAHVLNVRAYDEARTKILARDLGILEPDLVPEVDEKWVRRQLRRGVEYVYDCTVTAETVECYGGGEHHDNSVELAVGRDPDSGEAPEVLWSGVVLFRTLPGGRWVRLQYLDDETCELRLQELLDAY